MICILLFFSFQLTEFSFPYSDNIVWSPHKCPGYRLPVSLSTCFWASCHNRATYMVPPGMPDMQPKANPFPDDGTMHTFPSGLFSEYCLPHFLSAWGETFPLFWYGVYPNFRINTACFRGRHWPRTWARHRPIRCWGVTLGSVVMRSGSLTMMHCFWAFWAIMWAFSDWRAMAGYWKAGWYGSWKKGSVTSMRSMFPLGAIRGK